jgi:hypothetical protein
MSDTLGCNTLMPTRWKRIPITQDPELTEALRRVAPYFPGAAAARVVHDLALKGAEAIVQERGQSDRAVEELIAFSTERSNLIDWDVLKRIDELAWGE